MVIKMILVFVINEDDDANGDDGDNSDNCNMMR